MVTGHSEASWFVSNTQKPVAIKFMVRLRHSVRPQHRASMPNQTSCDDPKPNGPVANSPLQSGPWLNLRAACLDTDAALAWLAFWVHAKAAKDRKDREEDRKDLFAQRAQTRWSARKTSAPFATSVSLREQTSFLLAPPRETILLLRDLCGPSRPSRETSFSWLSPTQKFHSPTHYQANDPSTLANGSSRAGMVLFSASPLASGLGSG